MKRFSGWAHIWVFYLTAASLFGAIALRMLVTYRDDPRFHSLLGLLGCWLLTSVTATIIPKRRWYLPVYLIFQSILIMALLYLAKGEDYFAALFGILSMQIMQWINPKAAAAWIGLFAVLMIFPLVYAYGFLGGIAFAFIYIFGSVLLASYALAMRRAREAYEYNQSLMRRRQDANRQLQEYAYRIQQLAAARERRHLALELHDSVTQTIFTMTLTTQSALMLLDIDIKRVREQLERLNQLAQSSIVEMQALIYELNPNHPASNGLATAIRQHVVDLQRFGNLSVALDIEGNAPLTPLEERALFRIVQEALNNIIKHSGSTQAAIRLHLTEPLWVEISDQGQGFDLRRIANGNGVGLTGMRERAAEIGWNLRVAALPGSGVNIHIEKN
ncbi:MAG: sensor histidine kinase [Anaerolineales bacterium]|nr:MAG: sensor histidine kinase [Anaerolineales bacterium]